MTHRPQWLAQLEIGAHASQGSVPANLGSPAVKGAHRFEAEDELVYVLRCAHALICLVFDAFLSDYLR